MLYVEPDPAGRSGKPPRERWNAIDTSQAALLGLPQMEHIREDVQTVLARNRTIERVRDIVGHAGGTAPERGMLEAAGRTPDERRLGRPRTERHAERRPGPPTASTTG